MEGYFIANAETLDCPGVPAEPGLDESAEKTLDALFKGMCKAQ